MDEHFEEAVTNLIAEGNKKYPPRLSDISKAVDAAKVMANQRAARGYLGGYEGDLERAAGKNKTVDPEIVRTCIELLKDKLSGRITREQFYQGVELVKQASKS